MGRDSYGELSQQKKIDASRSPIPGCACKVIYCRRKDEEPRSDG